MKISRNGKPLKIAYSKFPYKRKSWWNNKSGYFLLNEVLGLVWVLRLFSIPSWLAPFFQNEREGKLYTNSRFVDVYIVSALGLSILIVASINFFNTLNSLLWFWVVVNILDIIQHQIRTVILRPVFHENYVPYSAERTLVIFVLQYIHTIILFCIVYLLLPDGLSDDLNVQKAMEFSSASITTLGFGQITPNPGSWAALISTFESVWGVIFLGLIVSAAVNRTRHGGDLVKYSEDKNISEACLSALQDNGYLSYIEKLSYLFHGDIWVVGGWVRAATLGLNYSGDIDCITTASNKYIEERLEVSGFCCQKNRFGGYRIRLADENHIDLWSARHGAKEKGVLDELKRLNFTINSAAVNVFSKREIKTDEFRLHAKSRKFRPLSGGSDNATFVQTLIEDMDVLERFYRLNPVKTKEYDFLDWHRKRLLDEYSDMSTAEALRVAKNRIKDIVPSGSNAWIVRGYVRCSLMGDLCYWDDIDVVVDCDVQDLKDSLSLASISWEENYFGNPKIFLESGSVVDIWSISGRSIESVLTKDFVFNVDSIAWEINEENLVLGRFPYEDHILRANDEILEELSNSQINYLALKAIYLIIRHGIGFDNSVERLIKRSTSSNSYTHKNAIRLTKELQLARVDSLDQKINRVIREIGGCEALLSFKKVIKDFEVNSL